MEENKVISPNEIATTSARNFVERIDSKYVLTKEFFKNYYVLKATKKAVDGAVKAADEQIKTVMQDRAVKAAEEGFSPNIAIDSVGKVTYTMASDKYEKVFDEESFKKDYPDLYEMYCINKWKATPERLTVTPNAKLLEEM